MTETKRYGAFIGEVVKYADHAAIVAAKDARISELEAVNKSVTKHYLRVTDERNEALYKVNALQEQVRALAAENLNRQHLLDMIGETGNANFGKTRIETPATDTVIREIRAQGVDQFAKHLRGHMQDGSPLGLLAMGADEFAARIRSGEKP